MSTRKRQAETARERLNAALADHLINDFTAYGAEVIANLRNEKPADYLKMVTTAFQSESARPISRAPSSNSAGRHSMRAYNSRPVPEELRMSPELEEVLRLTGG
ncbi:hypothetical protein [Sphingomonas crusticola]|uniref:hypothetical protein n=1 Tax=Sphingomonas crusticola TaxID=1697973 RepID=UPI000E23DCC9|nr:hypothetical protein [Sphingomonas crusticola]